MNAKCHIIQRRIEAAQGRIPADLVIKNVILSMFIRKPLQREILQSLMGILPQSEVRTKDVLYGTAMEPMLHQD